MIVGENCTFGHKRLGDMLTLEKYSETYGYSLTKLESLIIDGVWTERWNIANKLLGRPYQVSGVVAKGACRGREIGFPTINIPVEDGMIKPKFGTYYAEVMFSYNNPNWLYGESILVWDLHLRIWKSL